MTLQEFLQAYALVSGAHTAGHFNEASKQGLPISLDTKTFTENWGTPTSDRNAARMHGAGFEAQDNITRPMNDKAINLANALYKALYASGVTLAGSNMKSDGDIGATTEKSGNKYTRELVLASALSDLMKSQQSNPNMGLRFHVTDGAPGLMLDYRW